ncbi:hypothetical protein MJO28_011714 [Puccinia striiformis f. sp. tritici]|uniref:Uncharacterized protein n=1 Tax=Puccinia striiformis f. sp. tritici TaxID=168172 RepID=A0ACC0E3G5_9BASI|nr:hypothetical protein MJO28_011714 [Puccinia striiformis f. sp. tritici]
MSESDSSDDCCHGLDPHPLESEIQQHWPQGDLVTQGFGRLASKCFEESDTSLSPDSTGVTLSIDSVNFKNALLTRLGSSILPLLRQQLTTLSDLFKSSDFLNQPGPKLNLILEIQPSLEHNLDQIHSTIYTLYPEKLEEVPSQTNDQHEERAKIFRLHGLDECLNDKLFHYMQDLFMACSQLIRQLGLSREKCDHPRNIRYRLNLSTSWSQDAIQSTIKWVNGFELDLVQQRWPDQLEDIHSILEDFIMGTHPKTKRRIQSRRAAGKSLRKYPSEPALQVAESLIPVIKLSILFFNKVSHLGIYRKQLPRFTKISSGQLETLADSAMYSAFDLQDFEGDLLRTPSPRDFPSDDLTRRAQRYKTRLESAMFLIILYFLPGDFPVQDPNKAWFLDWHTAINQTIFNLVKTVKSVSKNVRQ